MIMMIMIREETEHENQNINMLACDDESTLLLLLQLVVQRTISGSIHTHTAHSRVASFNFLSICEAEWIFRPRSETNSKWLKTNLAASCLCFGRPLRWD